MSDDVAANGTEAGALVVVAGSPRADERGASPVLRGDANFIVQLLAAKVGLPSQRLKRRTAPDTGAAAYGSMIHRVRTRAGHAGRRRRRLDVCA